MIAYKQNSTDVKINWHFDERKGVRLPHREQRWVSQNKVQFHVNLDLFDDHVDDLLHTVVDLLVHLLPYIRRQLFFIGEAFDLVICADDAALDIWHQGLDCLSSQIYTELRSMLETV